MGYYHGSKDGTIEELKTDHTKDNRVYVTNSRLVALTYAVREYPNLFTTLPSGKEAFLELIPGLFSEMVKGKKCYIYTLEDRKYVPLDQSDKCGHVNCFYINENVRVIKKEYLQDAYSEFLKYIDMNEFVIVKPEDIPNREKIIQKIIETEGNVDLSNKESYVSLLKNNK